YTERRNWRDGNGRTAEKLRRTPYGGRGGRGTHGGLVQGGRQDQRVRGGRGRPGPRGPRRQQRSPGRRRLQERGRDPDRGVPPPRRTAEGGRRDRGLPGGQGGQRGPHRPLQGQGRQDQGLGRDHPGLREGLARRGPRGGGRQGRPERRRRREGVPAGLAGGPAAREEPDRHDRA